MWAGAQPASLLALIFIACKLCPEVRFLKGNMALIIYLELIFSVEEYHV